MARDDTRVRAAYTQIVTLARHMLHTATYAERDIIRTTARNILLGYDSADRTVPLYRAIAAAREMLYCSALVGVLLQDLHDGGGAITSAIDDVRRP
jgi:hypothetical protein